MNMRYTIILTALTTMLGVAVSCNMKPRKGASDGSMSQTAGTPDASGIINPVLAGDRPDPTVVKIGDTYYASATSNEWSPLFPIFRSDDLVNWELVTYVFPEGAPGWERTNFWEPELAFEEEQEQKK